jgi:hypothetical protein
MKRAIGVLGLGVFALGCTETPPTVTLRSLQASAEVTFVCRAEDGSGRSRDGCPDFDTESPGRPNHLFALVTQTSTGEVAVIDINAGAVVDVSPSVPGYTFLRVGARPRDIVTTPGGAASFVGSAELGKEGVYALPTTCIGPPRVRADGTPESERDLTTWPACALPVAPGDMAILIDPPVEDGVRVACGGSETESEPPPAALRNECAADLTAEGGGRGRRKLAVALPDLGEVVILDAQGLLDRDPGSFAPCEIERRLPLAVDLPVAGFEQPVPPDLATGDSCMPAAVTPPRPAAFVPRPSGFALSGRTLYVADEQAPVVHVIDVGNACEPVELPPLLPASFAAPQRVVTTTRLAASPLTPSGQQFLYAVDAHDQPGASLMVFDVSPGSTNRTPIVRSGSARLPFEPPDRIGFATSVRDVAFALRDLPVADPLLGVAPVGTACEPNPGSTGLGVAYRPNSDYTRGARPALLRGVFGFALLTSGQIAVIDAEDFDAPCRRPISANASGEPDFRGCAADPETSETFYTVNGVRTVTNEESCRVVTPHRTRSAALDISSPEVGVRAPSLRGFPILSLPQAVATRPLEERPRLLAVDFPGAPAQVNVGTTRYVAAAAGGAPENQLNTDPNTIDPNLISQNSLTLPLVEPRSYPASEAMTLSYEGSFGPRRPSGFLHFGQSSGDGIVNVLRDETMFFCSQGVYDVAQMRSYGQTELGIADASALDQFAVDHADYVQILSDFPESKDGYWSNASCARATCEAVFGPSDAEELAASRELRIVHAFQGQLEVESRSGGQELLDLMECCFPSGTAYALRVSRQWALVGDVSGFRHDIVAGPPVGGSTRSPCVRDCDPRKRFFRSRVFEISSSQGCPSTADGMTPEGGAVCRVGLAGPDDVACVYDQRNESVGPNGAVPQCIFESLTARFALYRGRCSEGPDCQPSVRGMVFRWQTSGGFIPLTLSLTSESGAVLPQSLSFLPELDGLAVVDGASLGLSIFSLNTLGIVRPSPFF